MQNMSLGYVRGVVGGAVKFLPLPQTPLLCSQYSHKVLLVEESTLVSFD